MRAEAVETLAPFALHDESVLALLEEIARSDQDAVVRQEAWEALEDLREEH